MVRNIVHCCARWEVFHGNVLMPQLFAVLVELA